MAKPNISLLGATYSGVAGVTLPKQGGGTATFPWVEGSETKTQNGTYDVTNLAQLIVNVAGGGGASNIVTGSFTVPTSSGVKSLTIPYTGTGYPIIAYVVVDGGIYNSTTNWYNFIGRYALGIWSMSKCEITTTPTYTTSGVNNNCTTFGVQKGSTSTATSYSSVYQLQYNTLSSSDAASNSNAGAFRFKTATSVSYYARSSSYGFAQGYKYNYYIVYSV